MSKIRDMGFEKVHTFILDAAFSAGTLLALLSDRIIGFSNSHIGPCRSATSCYNTPGRSASNQCYVCEEIY